MYILCILRYMLHSTIPLLLVILATVNIVWENGFFPWTQRNLTIRPPSIASLVRTYNTTTNPYVCINALGSHVCRTHLGYSDFDLFWEDGNFDMDVNSKRIIRHIHKRNFLFLSHSVILVWIQNFWKLILWTKQNFILNKSIWISKTLKFTGWFQIHLKSNFETIKGLVHQVDNMTVLYSTKIFSICKIILFIVNIFWKSEYLLDNSFAPNKWMPYRQLN
jgi:hypothetical protein